MRTGPAQNPSATEAAVVAAAAAAAAAAAGMAEAAPSLAASDRLCREGPGDSGSDGSASGMGSGSMGGRGRGAAGRDGGHDNDFRRLRRRRDKDGASTPGEQSPEGADGGEGPAEGGMERVGGSEGRHPGGPVNEAWRDGVGRRGAGMGIGAGTGVGTGICDGRRDVSEDAAGDGGGDGGGVTAMVPSEDPAPNAEVFASGVGVGAPEFLATVGASVASGVGQGGGGRSGSNFVFGNGSGGCNSPDTRVAPDQGQQKTYLPPERRVSKGDGHDQRHPHQQQQQQQPTGADGLPAVGVGVPSSGARVGGDTERGSYMNQVETDELLRDLGVEPGALGGGGGAGAGGLGGGGGTLDTLLAAASWEGDVSAFVFLPTRRVCRPLVSAPSCASSCCLLCVCVEQAA